MGVTMIDTLGPSGALNSANGFIDGLRAVLTTATCAQWTGTGGDSYRLARDEAVAQAQVVLDDIQAAVDLVPSLGSCAKGRADLQPSGFSARSGTW